MFETGMSALVLKICSEYAKSLGLNFPPCTQQEINAICEWVDKHTVKDMTISQNGYDVTFTFKTENDTTKEFTFTIPKKVDIDELEKVLVGSGTVVVNRSEDNSKLQVRLDQSVINDINSKLTKPTNPTSESVVTMTASGTVGPKPLSELGGGKLYRHHITASLVTLAGENARLSIGVDIINTSSVPMNEDEFKTYVTTETVASIVGMEAHGAVTIYSVTDTNEYGIYGAVFNPQNIEAANCIYSSFTFNNFKDTVTEL